MGAFGRRNEILEALRTQPRISTRDLSERFQVSEVTIRTDLDELAALGWVRRVHGGAELVRPLEGEQSFLARRHEHEAEKQRLARAAAALVQNGQTLLLDNSTSAYQLALALARHKALRVVTNSLPVAAALAPCSEIEVLILGGQLRRETLSIVGADVPRMLASLHADWLFLGTSGISATRGLTDADVREVEAKQAMIAHAAQVVALVDSSKFEREAFRTVAPLSALSRLVSDGTPPPALAQALADAGVQIIVA